MIHRNPKSGEERNAMEEIAWDDDDVNAQPKFALQRAAKNTESALWARRMADQNRNRPPLTHVFLNKVRYYIVAMLFLIFDVETIFLLPWAIIFMGEDFSFTKFALVEMFVFIGILVVGFYYAWRKGALEWV